MSVSNDELDLEVLKHALDHYSAQIPREEIDALLQLMQNWKHQQPNAAQQICQFAAQSEPIDRAYDHALIDLRRQYTTQQRAKSAVLTPQTHGELNGLTPIADQLIASLETILNPPTAQSGKTIGDNFDRIAIMGAGGAFLGGAIVQFLGGGSTQLVGALLGALVGILSGSYVAPKPTLTLAARKRPTVVCSTCGSRVNKRLTASHLSIGQPQIYNTTPSPLVIQSPEIIQEKILKSLTSSHFRIKDLTHIINQPLDRTQAILQQLWRSGYIDRLDSSLPYILFPSLRNQRYRQQIISPDQFLTITSKGYFHLYPLIARSRQG